MQTDDTQPETEAEKLTREAAEFAALEAEEREQDEREKEEQGKEAAALDDTMPAVSPVAPPIAPPAPKPPKAPKPAQANAEPKPMTLGDCLAAEAKAASR